MNNEIQDPRFRNLNLSSNAEGKVSTYLSIGNEISPPQFLKVVCSINGTNFQDEIIVDVF